VAAALTVTTLLAGVGSSTDLSRWYQSVGAPLPQEGFGNFVSRVARARVDTPYRHSPEGNGPESFRIELRRFECVSFVESTLAVARCAWRGEPTEACFVWEALGFRYRSGLMSDFASRLHYFVDWLEDNGGRWRLRDMTVGLGGTPVQRDFFYLTRRGARVAPLASPTMRRAMARIEARLSSQPHYVVGRSRIRNAVRNLREGDLVAIAGDKTGRLVTHAGFVSGSSRGPARFIHASSYHDRVVLTRRDVADYVLRRAERRGILVARPLAPNE
jgi:hypothetical protein